MTASHLRDKLSLILAGCGSHGCKISKPEGQGNNSMCQCRPRHIAATLAEIADELTYQRTWQGTLQSLIQRVKSTENPCCEVELPEKLGFTGFTDQLVKEWADRNNFNGSESAAKTAMEDAATLLP